MVLEITGAMSVVVTMARAGASLPNVTGSWAGWIWGASGLRVALGLWGGLGTIVGTKISGGTVAGSRAGLDLGTSGLRVVLGRRRPGFLVLRGGAFVDCADGRVSGSGAGLTLGGLGVDCRLGVEGIDVVCWGAAVVGRTSGLVKISMVRGSNDASLGASVALGCSAVLEVLGGTESRIGSLVAVWGSTSVSSEVAELETTS